MKTRTIQKINEVVIFDPSLYIRVHGKQPSGKAAWVFATDPNGDPNNWFCSQNKPLDNAKKDAISFFKGPRYNRRIYIMP